MTESNAVLAAMTFGNAFQTEAKILGQQVSNTVVAPILPQQWRQNNYFSTCQWHF